MIIASKSSLLLPLHIVYFFFIVNHYVLFILVCIVHHKPKNFISPVVLLITEFHNGDDFFVWTYDDVGLYSQSPKMVRQETETRL